MPLTQHLIHEDKLWPSCSSGFPIHTLSWPLDTYSPKTGEINHGSQQQQQQQQNKFQQKCLYELAWWITCTYFVFLLIVPVFFNACPASPFSPELSWSQRTRHDVPIEMQIYEYWPRWNSIDTESLRNNLLECSWVKEMKWHSVCVPETKIKNKKYWLSRYGLLIVWGLI